MVKTPFLIKFAAGQQLDPSQLAGISDAVNNAKLYGDNQAFLTGLQTSGQNYVRAAAQSAAQNWLKQSSIWDKLVLFLSRLFGWKSDTLTAFQDTIQKAGVDAKASFEKSLVEGYKGGDFLADSNNLTSGFKNYIGNFIKNKNAETAELNEATNNFVSGKDEAAVDGGQQGGGILDPINGWANRSIYDAASQEIDNGIQQQIARQQAAGPNYSSADISNAVSSDKKTMGEVMSGAVSNWFNSKDKNPWSIDSVQNAYWDAAGPKARWAALSRTMGEDKARKAVNSIVVARNRFRDMYNRYGARAAQSAQPAVQQQSKPQPVVAQQPVAPAPQPAIQYNPGVNNQPAVQQPTTTPSPFIWGRSI